jgi:hypothetical protein
MAVCKYVTYYGIKVDIEINENTGWYVVRKRVLNKLNYNNDEKYY